MHNITDSHLHFCSKSIQHTKTVILSLYINYLKAGIPGSAVVSEEQCYCGHRV